MFVTTHSGQHQWERELNTWLAWVLKGNKVFLPAMKNKKVSGTASLTPEGVAATIARRIREAIASGYLPQELEGSVSAHSLRRGGATFLALQGTPDDVI